MRQTDATWRALALRWGLATLVAIAAAGPLAAGERSWSVEIEPVYLEVRGHDQHVLTTHEIDFDGAPSVENRSAVTLDTEGALAYGARVEYGGEGRGWGLDFVMLRTDQGVGPLSAAAGGVTDRREFEVADRSFASLGPGQTLYFQTLEDTTVELWSLDLYHRRTVAESAGGTLDLLLGLRNADFDNDYRAVVGIDGVGGVRLDTSSNYGRMIGPLVGIAAGFEHGRHSLRGQLSQAVVWGEVELTNTAREFTGPRAPFAGPPEGVPAGDAQERFSALQDIAVPMTDLRLDWRYRLNDHWSLGAGARASAWWDLAVPPGVVPAPGGDRSLHENSIVLYGVGVAVRWVF